MKCAICLIVKKGVPYDAITVRSGTAVCGDHMYKVPDENVRLAFQNLPVHGGVVQYEE